jgi:hypothetical protein
MMTDSLAERQSLIVSATDSIDSETNVSRFRGCGLYDRSPFMFAAPPGLLVEYRGNFVLKRQRRRRCVLAFVSTRASAVNKATFWSR